MKASRFGEMVQQRDLPTCVTCSTFFSFLFYLLSSLHLEISFKVIRAATVCVCARAFMHFQFWAVSARARACMCTVCLDACKATSEPENMHKWYAHNHNYKSIIYKFEHNQSSMHNCTLHTLPPARRSQCQWQCAATNDSRNTLRFYFFFPLVLNFDWMRMRTRNEPASVCVDV